ncbi:hypothetical protein CEXT_237941 [Caerostris extrusa]|uniref:Uncharacterized protein n=1 Tax=Caerostris extrusa TaxID=172846 RepID=A0AAV4Q841_CAEEX|nr:hypothetical protein CEXT_237941 [Caerostris extrusa]
MLTNHLSQSNGSPESTVSTTPKPGTYKEDSCLVNTRESSQITCVLGSQGKGIRSRKQQDSHVLITALPAMDRSDGLAQLVRHKLELLP